MHRPVAKDRPWLNFRAISGSKSCKQNNCPRLSKKSHWHSPAVQLVFEVLLLISSLNFAGRPLTPTFPFPDDC